MAESRLACADAFFKNGLSNSLFLRESFVDSLEGEDWVGAARKLSDANVIAAHVDKRSDQKILLHWLDKISKQAKSVAALRLSVMVFSITGGVLGAVSMLGALSYSGSHPINLLVILAFFCAVPCIFTLLFVATNTFNKLAGRQSNFFGFVPEILTAVPQLKLHVNYSPLTTLWLLWRIQLMALLFQLFAMATFVVVLVFSDLAFAWSSTVIEGSGWFVSFVHAAAWPWAWLIEPPSADFIISSRYFRGDKLGHAESLGQWWSYLLLAMITYGFLPRVLLYGIFRARFKKAMRDDILYSGHLERFIAAVRSQEVDAEKSIASQERPEEKKNTLSVASIELDPSLHFIIGWKNTLYKNAPTLGLHSWESDEHWVNTLPADNMSNNARLAVLLCQVNVTPTAELIDICELLAYKFNEINLVIVMESNDQFESGDMASWLHFAKHNQLTIRYTRSSFRKPHIGSFHE